MIMDKLLETDILFEKYLRGNISYIDLMKLVKIVLENEEHYAYCSMSLTMWQLHKKYNLFAEDN